jgi:hypothetical protein
MPEPKSKLTQVLPNAGRMPNLPVSRELAAQLIEIAAAAMRAAGKDMSTEFGDEPLVAILAPAKAQRAAEFYVRVKVHETPLPDFRKMLDRKNKGSLAAAAVQLLTLLGSDNEEPPFAQMRQLFCAADPLVDGLDASTDEAEQTDDTAPDVLSVEQYDNEDDLPEGIWRANYSPEIVRKALVQWLALMDDLYERSGGGKSAPGRSPIDAEVNFVSWLATYWTRELGLPLSSGRGGTPVHAGGPDGHDLHDQQGSFANFVRKSAEIIPMDWRPKSWDRAIRQNLPKRA